LAGIGSLHVPVADDLSAALSLAVIAGSATSRLCFRVGWEFTGVLASLRGCDLHEASHSLGGRLIVHMRFPESTSDRDYDAMAELIGNLLAALPQSVAPLFEVEGESAEAAFLAIRQSDCLWRLPHRPAQTYADALPILHFGKEVGVHCYTIARETCEEAREEAAARLTASNATTEGRWITPRVWRDSTTAVLAGSFEEVARAIREYRDYGVSHLLVREWPGREEGRCFAARILPLLRSME
jgi:hypothetical protein